MTKVPLMAVITVGIPASGKSTFSAHFSAKYNLRIISSDAIRIRICGMVFTKEAHRSIYNEMVNEARIALHSGRGFILDTTFFNRREDRSEIISAIRALGKPVQIVVVPFDVPLDECRRRNALRVGTARVPDEMLCYFSQELELPLSNERGIDHFVDSQSLQMLDVKK